MNKVINLLILSLCYLRLFGGAPNIHETLIQNEHNQEDVQLNQETFTNLKNAIEQQNIPLMEHILLQINDDEKITYYLES